MTRTANNGDALLRKIINLTNKLSSPAFHAQVARERTVKKAMAEATQARNKTAAADEFSFNEEVIQAIMAATGCARKVAEERINTEPKLLAAAKQYNI